MGAEEAQGERERPRRRVLYVQKALCVHGGPIERVVVRGQCRHVGRLDDERPFGADGGRRARGVTSQGGGGRHPRAVARLAVRGQVELVAVGWVGGVECAVAVRDERACPERNVRPACLHNARLVRVKNTSRVEPGPTRVLRAHVMEENKQEQRNSL